MLNALWNLLCFLVALGILISVHEAGHFFAARWSGVRVLRFSIGFGRILCKKTGKDGCEYALSVFPLGGYVKMLGENDAPTPDGTLAEGSFKSKSIAVRAFIVAAGPACNILLAVLFFSLVNLTGITVLKPVAGDVVPGSAAAVAGLQREDLILSVNSEEVRSWQDVLEGLIVHSGESTPVSLQAAAQLGREPGRELRLSLEDFRPSPSGGALQQLGLKPCYGRVTRELSQVEAGSPAAVAGLAPGDIILSVNGIDTPDWFRVQEAVASSDGGTIALEVRRGEREFSLEVLPVFREDRKGKAHPYIGVGVKMQQLPELTEEIRYPFFEALAKGVEDTLRKSRLVAEAVLKMLDGSISAENISGPIAIARGAGGSASIGITLYISFLAVISVNLGILNLLPVPILDGGQLVFLLYEALAGREPAPRVQMILSSLGFGLLLSLMLLAVFNDIRTL